MKALRKATLLSVLLILSVLAFGCAATVPSPTAPTSQAQPQPQQITPAGSSQQASSAVKVEGKASFDRNFLMVYDDSGSMGKTSCGENALNVEIAPGKFANTRIDVQRWAAAKFVRESVPSDVNLGFYPLNTVQKTITLGKDNREKILQAIENINAGGVRGTPLNGALQQATDVLIAQREKQLGYGEYYIIVMTDGEATDGPGDARNGATYAGKNGIAIMTIGFCLTQGHALSSHSLNYRNALDAQQLLEALKQTQAELPEYDTK